MNKKLLLLAMLQSIYCFGAEDITSFPATSLSLPEVAFEELIERLNKERTLLTAANCAEVELLKKYPECEKLMSVEGIIEEAQKKYGINPQKALPLKDIDSSSLEAQLFTAHVTCDAIVVNRNVLQFQSVGARRVTLFHEISHEINGDDQRLATNSNVAGLATAAASSAAFLKKTGFSKKGLLTIPLSVATFLVSKLCALNIQHHFIEHRADTDGIMHAACSECASEFAANTRIRHAYADLNAEMYPLLGVQATRAIVKNRYLSPEAASALGQALEGKTCKVHQLMAEFPVLKEAIEYGQTNMLNAITTRTQELKKQNELLRLKQVAELHSQQSHGPLLNDFF